jgi:hypothetical protein
MPWQQVVSDPKFWWALGQVWPLWAVLGATLLFRSTRALGVVATVIILATTVWMGVTQPVWWQV